MAKKSQADDLSKDQIIKFSMAFSMLDKNHNGTIQINDLETVLRSLGQTLTQMDVQNVINSGNANGSGTIQLVEFLDMMALKIKDREDEETLEALQIFDKDDNGLVSVLDLYLVLTNLGKKRTDKEISDLMRKAVVNGKGQVYYKDLVAKMKSSKPK